MIHACECWTRPEPFNCLRCGKQSQRMLSVPEARAEQLRSLAVELAEALENFAGLAEVEVALSKAKEAGLLGTE